jgi:hypothetical protein
MKVSVSRAYPIYRLSMDPLIETVEEGCARWRSNRDALHIAMNRDLLSSRVETNNRNGELLFPREAINDGARHLQAAASMNDLDCCKFPLIGLLESLIDAGSSAVTTSDLRASLTSPYFLKPKKASSVSQKTIWLRI